MKNKNTKKQIGYWIVWLVCLIFLGVVVGIASQKAEEYEDKEAYIMFQESIKESEEAIRNRMLFYEEGLRGGVGLFNASEQVDRNEWIAYVEALDVREHYPGINGIGFIQPVKKKDLTGFVQKSQEDDYPEFKISNVGDINEDEDYIILYIEPLEINKQAVGLNIGSERNRRDAAERARDTGIATMTHIIQLVQDAQKKAGFLLLLPVYEHDRNPVTLEQRREALRGWVYAPFVGENFLRGIINTDTLLDFAVYDTENIIDENLIYRKVLDEKHISKFEIQKPIFLGNDTWTILWRSTAELEAQFQQGLPLIVLVIGMTLSIILLGIVGFLLIRQYRAVVQSEEAQSSLEESESKFTQAFQNAPIGMALVSLKGKWIQVNKALCDIFGYTETEILKKDFQSMMHSDDLKSSQNFMQRLINGEQAHYQAEKRFYNKKKSIVWTLVNVSLIRDRIGEPLYFVAQIEDITVRKQSETSIQEQKASLERLNKVMVGRELKMIEMKKSLQKKKKK